MAQSAIFDEKSTLEHHRGILQGIDESAKAELSAEGAISPRSTTQRRVQTTPAVSVARRRSLVRYAAPVVPSWRNNWPRWRLRSAASVAGDGRADADRDLGRRFDDAHTARPRQVY